MSLTTIQSGAQFADRAGPARDRAVDEVRHSRDDIEREEQRRHLPEEQENEPERDPGGGHPRTYG